MSDNPFASTPGSSLPAQPTAQKVPKKAPGALTTILVICLILGILGLLSSCMGGITYAASSVFEKMAIEGAVDDAQRELQESNFAVQKRLMIPGIALTGINLIVATMLCIGSILGMQRKESGRKILGFGLIGAILYAFPKMAFAIYQSMITAEASRETVDRLRGEPGAEQIEMIASVSVGFGWGIAIFMVIVALAMLGFYIWAKLYLGKDKIVAHFTP